MISTVGLLDEQKLKKPKLRAVNNKLIIFSSINNHIIYMLRSLRLAKSLGPRLGRRFFSDIGGKTKGLMLLEKYKYNVPKFISVHSENVDKGHIDNVVQSNFPDYVKYFAVRSSAANEDGEHGAMAGQFYTALGVTRDHIFDEAQNVVESFGDQNGTVVIQQFVNSDRSGVMFTNAGAEVTAINANKGLCDSVVKGDPCDEYLLNHRGEVIRKKVVDKVPLELKDGKVVECNSTSEQAL